MLREQVPDFSEEALAAALKPGNTGSNTQLSQSATAPRPPAAHPASQKKLDDSPTASFPQSNVAVVHVSHVPIPFPTQSLDPLHFEDHGGSASPVPGEESPYAHHDASSNGGIVIHEKYHDLFVTPPVLPERDSVDDMHSLDTSRSVNTPPPPQTTATADDDSFYPEDEIMGVAV
jgi:hypothetical protein